MEDAVRLAMPVGEGILWSPSSLDDIHSIPARTLLLFDFYQLGVNTRRMPWTWWRLEGKRTTAHQYGIDWQSIPQPPARCGYAPPEGVKLESSEIAKCAKCQKLDRGETTEATGTVAGVKVGGQ